MSAVYAPMEMPASAVSSRLAESGKSRRVKSTSSSLMNLPCHSLISG